MDELGDAEPRREQNRRLLRHELREIYSRLSPARRRQFLVVLLLMCIGAAADLTSIGAVVPFLALLADPAGLDHFGWAASILEKFGAATTNERLLTATAIFSIVVLISGVLRLQLTWYLQNFVFRVGHEISVDIHRRLLARPYGFHLERHSASLVSAIAKTESLIFDLLLPVMQAIVAVFISSVVVAALIFIDAAVAIGVAVVVCAIYLAVTAATRKRLAANSRMIGSTWDDRIKVAQESLDGIRDVILDNAQELHLGMFEKVNLRLSLARANTVFLGMAPRFLIEAVGMVAIAVIAAMLSIDGKSLAVALPVLGAIALGAQRLLPLLQQIYTAWSTAVGNRALVTEVLDLLRLPIAAAPQISGPAALPLGERISIRDVRFTYPGRRRPSVDQVSFEIPARSSVALVGPTGSGKSTLADLIMGLLDPQQGAVLVDGVELGVANRQRWQKSVSHVPQSIFLADASIAWNIALSVPDEAPDHQKLVAAATKAQLHDFIESLPAGYDTVVGERGVRLSGGQRQRVGLARAIYKGATVLVLDEATSALDEAVETSVLDALEALRREGHTIIMIAHRQSTVRHCQRVLRLEHGRVAACGSLEEVLGQSEHL